MNLVAITNTQMEAIRSVEVAAFEAWPALERAEVAGWRLRAAEGITGRANSVWALEHDGSLSLSASIDAAESFYTDLGLPPRFQINQAARPAGLDMELERRGYSLYSPTQVQTVALAEVVARTPALRLNPGLDVLISEQYDAAWFELYVTAEAMDGHTRRIREAILRRVPSPCGFASLTLDGEPAAVGLGVVSRAWQGIFCMTTLPQMRRRGAATAILRTLAIWAQLHGATNAYLQVKADNAAAQAVYGRAGFLAAYDYHYRVRDEQSARQHLHREAAQGPP